LNNKIVYDKMKRYMREAEDFYLAYKEKMVSQFS
jgi:hypothetical protein